MRTDLLEASGKPRCLPCTSNQRAEAVGVKVGAVVQMGTGTFRPRNMGVGAVGTDGARMTNKRLVAIIPEIKRMIISHVQEVVLGRRTGLHGVVVSGHGNLCGFAVRKEWPRCWYC